MLSVDCVVLRGEEIGYGFLGILTIWGWWCLCGETSFRVEERTALVSRNQKKEKKPIGVGSQILGCRELSYYVARRDENRQKAWIRGREARGPLCYARNMFEPLKSPSNTWLGCTEQASAGGTSSAERRMARGRLARNAWRRERPGSVLTWRITLRHGDRLKKCRT